MPLIKTGNIKPKITSLHMFSLRCLQDTSGKVIKFSQAYIQVGSRQSKDLEQNFPAKETEMQKATKKSDVRKVKEECFQEISNLPLYPHPIPKL